MRDSLFENSAAGGQNLREKAIDTALQLARAAPLDMQEGVRQGAGRIDSLLGGSGPQPASERVGGGGFFLSSRALHNACCPVRQ